MQPTTFDALHLHPDVLAGIKTAGYNTPTPLQAQAIPLIMQGKDVIGLGEPGAGKTAAFIIPILHRLRKGEPGSTRALILSPSIKSAEQTSNMISRLGARTGLLNLAVYAATGTTSQAKELRQGPDIISGRPNHLLSYLWKGTINLASLEILVIDEADSMAEQGLLEDIFNVLMSISQKRQTLLFTDRMPENIRRVSRQFLNNPVTVPQAIETAVKPAAQIKKPSAPSKDINMQIKKPVSTAAKPTPPTQNQALRTQNQDLRNQNQSLRSQNQNLRTQKPEPHTPDTTPKPVKSAKPERNKVKTTFLKDIVNKSKGDSVRVFTRALKNAGRVALQLKNSGYQVTPLKGNLLAKKKTGKSGGLPGGPVIILVVRDSAARGIDVSKIFRTINYETPEGAVDDAHRVGRRGKVDKYGDAIALVTSADALNIHALEQILEAPLAPLENV